MRYLFFTNTPAHAHLYRHAVETLREMGHEVLVLARDYGCTLEILEWHDVSHEVYGYCGTAKTSLLCRLPAHYARAMRSARRFDPDLVFGMGGYAAHTGLVTGASTVLLIDSEATSIDHSISTPFARTVLTPDTFRKDLGDAHYVFPGLKECAYLHPNVYSPDPTIRDRLDLAADEPYVIVRLNAFGSHHDVGKEGITEERFRRLVAELDDHATILVSDEGGDRDLDGLPVRPFDLHPALMHDALAEAELLIADTQTMVTEAALLGTPAIRSNSFVGDSDMGNFLELEERNLIFNVSRFDEVVDRATSLLRTDGIEETWRRRRDEYLSDKVNLTDVIVDLATGGGRVEGLDALRRFGKPAPEPTEPAKIDRVSATQD